MARLFPFRSEPSQTEGQPRIVDLEGEDADAVFSALSSSTARQIYARLDDEPGTPSDIADAIDSSIQNVRYHLENLEDAGLVEVVDTWYSSRGNEMSVYATTDGPLIVTSDESTASRLREALSRFVGGVGVLAAGGLLVQHGLTWWAESATSSSPEDTTATGLGETDETDGSPDEDTADDVGTRDTESNDEAVETAGDNDVGTPQNEDVTDDTDLTAADGNESAENMTDGGAEVAEAIFELLPPGVLFFLGGLVVLTAVICYWYWYRPAY